MTPGTKVKIVTETLAQDAFGRPVRYEITRVEREDSVVPRSLYYITAIYDWKMQAQRWEYSWIKDALSRYSNFGTTLADEISKHAKRNDFKMVWFDEKEVLM